jgi:hypothetical protein
MFVFMVTKLLQVIQSNYTPVYWSDWVIGILLCAKTKLAKTRLAAYFADGTSYIEGNRFGE